MISETDTFTPINQEDWRKWLEKNHQDKEGIWLIFYKKSSSKPNLSWSQAVDEALCFGWIDSVKKTIDTEKYKQYFSPRKAKSNWSKVNKEKIENLLDSNLMQSAGLKSIEIAKQNGSWTILDAIENLEIPIELDEAFKKYANSKSNFLNFSKSVKKLLLYWVVSAKRAETKNKRVNELAECAHENKKPKQFR
jgi:uncharacterized protein YdeI (YjbR/CyaY-like superfamily)